MTSDSLSISPACSAIDCMLTKAIKIIDLTVNGNVLVKPSLFSMQQACETNHPWILYLMQNGEVLVFWLRKILSRLMMEDCTNQWTLSQPLYPLFILIDSQVIF